MKFLVTLCLLAFAAAADEANPDQDKNQDTNVNTSSLTQQPANNLLSGSAFLPSTFANVFPTNDQISNLAYTGFQGNVSPVQGVNPDLFNSATAGAVPVNSALPVNSGLQLPVNAGLPLQGTFPITIPRAVLPGTTPVVGGIQTGFPATGNVFPGVNSQFPTGILPTGAIDPNAPAPAFRFPEVLPGAGAQGLQPAQQLGLAAIPAFTSGILPSLGNLQNQFQGQNLQQFLKNPTATPAGLPVGIPTTTQGITAGNIPTGQLSNVFRQS